MTNLVGDVAVTVSANVQPRPDGSFWVGVQFEGLGYAFVTAFPPDVAETFADNFPEKVKDAAQEARRRTTGLLVPGE